MYQPIWRIRRSIGISRTWEVSFWREYIGVEVAIEMFVGGLRKEIYSLVLLLRPRNLREAYAMAQLQEDN